MEFRYKDKPVGPVLSEWTPVPNDDGSEPHCCMRYLLGTDQTVVANRIAFIEKTPRIRVGTGPVEQLNWEQGPKGSGCSGDQSAEKEQRYGFYPPSREWCDQRLKELGYWLTEQV